MSNTDDPDLVRDEDDTPDTTPDADTTPDTEPATDTPAAPVLVSVPELPATAPAAAGPSRWIERGVAAVLLIAALVTAGWFYQQNKDSRDVAAARQSAQDAACAYAPTLANYDAKDLDSYFNAVLAGATGGWKQQFTQTSKDLRDVLVQGQVVSKVGDVQCALKSGDKNRADVVVVIGQSVSSVGTKGQPQPGQLSMVLSLQKDGGRWLVDKVDTPLAPQQ